MSQELTPDMIWRLCPDCEKHYTLADAVNDGQCPRCNSPKEDRGDPDES